MMTSGVKLEHFPNLHNRGDISLEVIVPKNLQLFLGIIYRFQKGTQVTNPCPKKPIKSYSQM